MSDVRTIIERNKEKHADYIGDGVYVSWDGYNIWIRTPREEGVHEVALDPYSYASLTQYASRLNALLAIEADNNARANHKTEEDQE